MISCVELAVVLSRRQGEQAGRRNRNPTKKANSLAWKSRVRRTDNESSAKEKPEGKVSTTK